MNCAGVFRVALVLGTSALLACTDRPATPAVAPPMPAVKQIYVVVERGQSLDRIAQMYRVAKQDIIAANQLKPPYELKPGTVLAMPASPAQPLKDATAGQATCAAPPGCAQIGSTGHGSYRSRRLAADQTQASTARGNPARLISPLVATAIWQQRSAMSCGPKAVVALKQPEEYRGAGRRRGARGPSPRSRWARCSRQSKSGRNHLSQNPTRQRCLLSTSRWSAARVGRRWKVWRRSRSG